MQNWRQVPLLPDIEPFTLRFVTFDVVWPTRALVRFLCARNDPLEQAPLLGAGWFGRHDDPQRIALLHIVVKRFLRSVPMIVDRTWAAFRRSFLDLGPK